METILMENQIKKKMDNAMEPGNIQLSRSGLGNNEMRGSGSHLSSL